MGRWRHEGSRSDMREVEAVTHEAVDRFGYERTLRGFEVPLLTNRARARHHLREPRQAARDLGARLRPSGVTNRS